MVRASIKNIVVCGIPVISMHLDTHVDTIDITDGTMSARAYIPTGTTTTYLSFDTFWDKENLDVDTLFPVGEGNFYAHNLGPSDVCQYCGTAWLSGTLQCYNCGGETNHSYKAIEYNGNHGIITRKTIECRNSEAIKIRVEVEFYNLVFYDDPLRMFQYSLWRNVPAMWVCRFCGYIVLGKQANCPGCGGNRVPIKELASQKRYCIYCGGISWGNYACQHCNTRLMVV